MLKSNLQRATRDEDDDAVKVPIDVFEATRAANEYVTQSLYLVKEINKRLFGDDNSDKEKDNNIESRKVSLQDSANKLVNTSGILANELRRLIEKIA